MPTASVLTSAFGVVGLVLALAFLWLGLVLVAEDGYETYCRPDRVRLAGHDDRDIDFAAALRAGPFPPYRTDTALLGAGCSHPQGPEMALTRDDTSVEQGGSGAGR
jgi:hypothetical protein